jgi:hypothetical protein
MAGWVTGVRRAADAITICSFGLWSLKLTTDRRLMVRLRMRRTVFTSPCTVTARCFTQMVRSCSCLAGYMRQLSQTYSCSVMFAGFRFQKAHGSCSNYYSHNNKQFNYITASVTNPIYLNRLRLAVPNGPR